MTHIRLNRRSHLIPAVVLVLLGALVTFVGREAASTAATTTAAPPTAVNSADAYVRSSAPNGNYGTATTLQENATASAVAVAYVMFNVQGLAGAPTKATLRLFSRSSGVTRTKVFSTSSGWTEQAITWANRPALGAQVGTTGTLTNGSWTEADVTNAVAGNGMVSLALTTTATATRSADSREAANAPQLVITGASTPTPPPTGTVTKVLAIIEENHSLAQMKAGMPYLYGLAQRFSYADNYTAIRHPSEPNYLAIAGGSTFGDTSDHNPAFQVAGQSIFGQAVAANKTAKLYAESMTSNCQQSSGGTYAVKHNPWASFTAERSACQAGDVPVGTTTAGALLTNINAGTLPNAGMVVPNMCNDAHDCPLGTADSWLQGWLPKILAGSDFTSGRLAVVVTADEDDSSSGNKVLTVVLHPSLDGSHKVVTTALTHYSLTGLYDSVLGTPMLGSAAGAPKMRAAFTLP